MPRETLTLPATQDRLAVPSGYEQAAFVGMAQLGQEILPWVREPLEVAVTQCSLQGGQTFYLASAVKSHPKLVEAAESMNAQQRTNADNMFYSRLAGFVQQGYSSNVETMEDPATPANMYVMRNNGGQRVYFTIAPLKMEDGQTVDTVIRLGVCDKNQQAKALRVLSSKKEGERRKRLSK